MGEYPVLQIQVEVQIAPMIIKVQASMGGEVEVGIEALNVVHIAEEPYTGPTTIVPDEHAQIVQIAGKTAVTNIRIEPIPQNWGKITWNGATLTVS